GSLRPEPPDPRSAHADLPPVAVMAWPAPCGGVPRTATLDTPVVGSFTRRARSGAASAGSCNTHHAVYAAATGLAYNRLARH
ncbi:MAG: hypothetical protein ACRDRB_21010, partial [Pseudonocardiaceae bacterium]